MLKSVNAPTDEYYLTYEATTGDFEWQIGSGSSLWQQSGDTLSPLTDGDNLQLESTTTASNGVIFKGITPWMHDFHHPTGSTAIPVGQNIFIGNAGNFTTGSTVSSVISSSNLIGIGFEALKTNTTGSRSIAIGQNALKLNTTGTINTAVGNLALQSNIAGQSNTAIGASSLVNNTNGLQNTGIGVSALQYITTGTGNIGIGFGSGASYGSGTSQNTTADSSIYIGYDVRASANGVNNEIVFGSKAIANGPNTATILNEDGTDVWIGQNGQAATIQTIVKLLPTADPPSSPSLGWIYADTDTHLYFYNGSAWVQLD